MAYKYKLTHLALSDIDEVLEYISVRLTNPVSAKRLYQALKKEIRSICENPRAFPNCSCYLIDDENIRHALVGNYVLIYEVCKEERQVNILRFLYGGRDIANTELN